MNKGFEVIDETTILNQNVHVIQRIPSPSYKIKPKITVEKPLIPIKGKLPSSAYMSIITNSNCELELSKAGYIVNHKIITKDEKNNEIFSYIKAIDKNGNNVYVLIDEAGYLSTTEKDMQLSKSDSNLVPFSVKNGLYESVGLDAMGVAIECGSLGICTMTRNHEMKPVEHNFISGRPDKDSVDRFYSYPIIKLSEIKHHPYIMLQNVQNVSSRILTESFRKCVSDLSEFKRNTEELLRAITKFDTLRTNITSSWNERMYELDTFADDTSIQHKYNDLNNYAECLVTTINTVTTHNTQLKSIITNINDLNSAAETKFSTLLSNQ